MFSRVANAIVKPKDSTSLPKCPGASSNALGRRDDQSRVYGASQTGGHMGSGIVGSMHLVGLILSHSIRAVTFLPDSRRVLSVGPNKAFKLWDVTTGELLHDFVGHPQNVTSVSVSGDGKLAVTGCESLNPLETGETRE